MAQQEAQELAIAAADALDSLSRLSGWVAHEVNNPLAGMQNAFALLQDLIPTTHPHYKYVSAIDREIARIAALTQRLQQTYRYDDSQAMVSPARFVADAVRALEPLHGARRVTLQVDIQQSATLQMVGGVLLRAAIRHLVQHAVELAPPDTALRITAWCDADRLWFSVPDHEESAAPARRIAAGPPGLALQLARRLVRVLGGTTETIHDGVGMAEIRIGVPLYVEAKEAE